MIKNKLILKLIASTFIISCILSPVTISATSTGIATPKAADTTAYQGSPTSIKKEADNAKANVKEYSEVYCKEVASESTVPDIVDYEKLETTETKYTEFQSALKNKKVVTAFVDFSTIIKNDDFYYITGDGVIYQTPNPAYEDFKKDLLEAGVNVKPKKNVYLIASSNVKGKNTRSSANTIILLLTFGVIGFAVYYCTKDRQGGNIFNKKMQVVGKGGKVPETPEAGLHLKKFSDVAGLKEVKRDMQCLVDFLKNSEKYKEAGAKLPKGVILYGPPGTGKTLLAKAVAGEAGVPFFYMSGSDFVEMYVGVGAKRVRELFQKAKKQAPCIIFIDEIDAIGGKRGKDDNGEDRKTLNALLAEMDGFKSATEVLVIGATNRLDDLDSALVRAGRFTEKFCVPLPETMEDRLAIMNLYSQNKKFDESVDFKTIAKETIGCSPADIEAIFNEAAITSVLDKKQNIDKDCFDKAFYKKLMNGHQRENKERKHEELQLVAWHEAGHALVGKLHGDDVTKVTILSSTSGAGGVTFSTPSKVGLYSIEDFENRVKQLYAGRIAEYLLYKDWNKITTGASNDIERATKIIREMISIYGMEDENGLLCLEQLKVDDKIIIEQAKKISKKIKEDTIKEMTEHLTELEEIANLLLEKETIHSADLDRILNIKEEVSMNA